jgi:DNA-binding transcriptional MerR regulator
MRDAGVSRQEIKMAIEESRSSFKRRQQTVKNLKMQPVEEALEKTKRKFVKLTGRARK